MSQINKRVGLYPGTFDPITRGHKGIIERASKLVDHLIIAVADNPGKGPLFNTPERVAMIEEEVNTIILPDSATIQIAPFSNLLVHFAEDMKASVIIRGLRAVTDFEYEFQMTGMNAQVAPNVETIFLMSQDKYQFISSSFVKEIGRLGGDISKFVSPHVSKKLAQKFSE